MAFKKKIASSLLVLTAMSSVLGTTALMGSWSSTDSSNKTINIDNKNVSKAIDVNLSGEGQEIIDASKYILDNITSAGIDMIKGGIATYAKTLTLDILKDYGFDFRDLSVKYLEQVISQLEEIRYKLDNMDQKIVEYNAQEVMNKLKDKLDKTENEYMSIAKGLFTLAKQEQSGEYSEVKMEELRKQYYDENLKDISVKDYDLLVNYVKDLAKSILEPNSSDTSQEHNLFYYYSLTLGKYDKWSYQEYKDRRAYIAYVSTMLLSAVNVAQFDMYYRSQGVSAATLDRYNEDMKEMAKAVNSVFAMFQAELKRLDEIDKVRIEDKTVTYLPTNKQYSTRMATLTFNPDDKVGNESRQAFLVANINICRGGYMDDGYAYQPDTNFISQVQSDFKSYASAYGNEDYSIVKYLKDAGFGANNQDLFDKAAGVYYGNADEITCDYLNHDEKLFADYIDLKGDKQSKNFYEVCCYHNWIGCISRTEFRNHDNNYYLCFMNPDQKTLDGCYKYCCFDQVVSTISDNLFYKVRHSWYSSIPAEVKDCW